MGGTKLSPTSSRMPRASASPSHSKVSSPCSAGDVESSADELQREQLHLILFRHLDEALEVHAALLQHLYRALVVRRRDCEDARQAMLAMAVLEHGRRSFQRVALAPVLRQKSVADVGIGQSIALQ